MSSKIPRLPTPVSGVPTRHPTQDDRDVLRPKNTPPGLIENLIEEAPDTWEDQSGDGVGSTGVVEKPVTGETPVQTLVRRSADTKNDIRVEVLPRLSVLETQVNELIIPALAKNEKQNEKIIQILLDERKVTTETVLSQVRVTETEKTNQSVVLKEEGLSLIRQREAIVQTRLAVFKEYALRILAGLGIAGAAVLATISAGRC